MFTGVGKTPNDAASVRTPSPIPPACGLYYFEVKIISKGRDGYMGIGLTSVNFKMNRLPGWDKQSYGYHGDDGNSFCSSGNGQPYGPTFTTGDIIGCGVNMVNSTCFYTKNGHHLGTAFRDLPVKSFFVSFRWHARLMVVLFLFRENYIQRLVCKHRAKWSTPISVRNRLNSISKTCLRSCVPSQNLPFMIYRCRTVMAIGPSPCISIKNGVDLWELRKIFCNVFFIASLLIDWCHRILYITVTAQRPKVLLVQRIRNFAKTLLPLRIDKVSERWTIWNWFCLIISSRPPYRNHQTSYVRANGTGHRAHSTLLSGTVGRQPKSVVHAKVSTIRWNGERIRLGGLFIGLIHFDQIKIIIFFYSAIIQQRQHTTIKH